jgi:hypothetical protein
MLQNPTSGAKFLDSVREVSLCGHHFSTRLSEGARLDQGLIATIEYERSRAEAR